MMRLFLLEAVAWAAQTVFDVLYTYEHGRQMLSMRGTGEDDRTQPPPGAEEVIGEYFGYRFPNDDGPDGELWAFVDRIRAEERERILTDLRELDCHGPADYIERKYKHMDNRWASGDGSEDT